MTTARERSGVAKPKVPIASIVVNGQTVTVDQRVMTMRERQLVKAEMAKLPYEADEMDALVGAIWVAMRRTDPKLSFDDVADAVTFGDLVDAETVEDETSPEA